MRPSTQGPPLPCLQRHMADPRLRHIWIFLVAFLALFGLIIVVASQPERVSQRAGVAGTWAPRVCTAQLYLYVLQPGVGAAASPSTPLCNHYQPVFVKYKLQTIQRPKGLSVSSHSLS